MKTLKPNVRLLRRIARKALKAPEAVQMAPWGARVKKDEAHPCGAVGCIAGTAVLLDSPHMFSALVKARYHANWQDAGMKALGLLQHEAESLFYVSLWPAAFAIRHHTAPTPKAKARVIAARIEHFIKTGE